MDRNTATENELNHHPMESLEASETKAVDLLAYMIIRVPLVGALLGAVYGLLFPIVFIVIPIGLPIQQQFQTLDVILPSIIVALCGGAITGGAFSLLGGLPIGIITGFALLIVTKLFMIRGQTQYFSLVSTILCTAITILVAMVGLGANPNTSYFTYFEDVPSSPLNYVVFTLLPTLIGTVATGWVVWRKTSAIERGTDRPKRKKKIDKELQA